MNLSPPHLYQCRVCDSRGDGSAPFRVVFGPQLHLFDPPEWPDWTPIAGRLPPQAPFPLQEFPLRPLVEAAVTLAGGASIPTVAGCLLGGLAAVAQADYRCQGLARGYIPCSLFTVCISESGWRKSTAAKMFWDILDRSDTIASAAWYSSREAYRAAEPPEKDAMRNPTDARPTLIQRDFTSESMYSSLEKGRLVQAAFSDEAGVQVQNWSGSGAHLGRTLSILSSMWDGSTITWTRTTDKGRDTRIPNYALSLTWLGQARVMDPVVMGEAASDGFCARTLLARDDTRPEAQQYMSEEDAEALLSHWDQIVQGVRTRQDDVLSFYPGSPEAGWKPQGFVRLTEAAQNRLTVFNNLQVSASDDLLAKQALHERSFAVRAAEQAARVAAVFTIWREYERTNGRGEPAPDLLVDDEDMASAISVVRWYQGELNRLASQANMTLVAQLANRVEDKIAEEYQKNESRYIRDGHIVLNSLVVQQVRQLKNDPVLRDEVLARLAQEGHVRMVTRGRYAVHPHLLPPGR